MSKINLMYIKKSFVFILILFSLFIGLFLRIFNGIGPNFELELPYSYKLCVYSSDGQICGPNGLVVATVNYLNIYDHYIIGYKKENGSFNEGYCVINMKTQEIISYNNIDDVKQTLHNNGYPVYQVELIGPTFFFNLFRSYK